MNYPEIAFVDGPHGQLAYRQREGGQPTLLFLPGYASDMEGAKAQAVDAFAAEHGLGMVRFDYSGTGSSAGSFGEGTLKRWLDECSFVVDRLTSGPLILVGSSMGGWLALLLAISRPERLRAIVGIAAAPDFTEWGFSDADRLQLRSNGRIAEDLEGGHGRHFTLAFWESGQQLRLLGDEEVPVDCPVRLVHGDSDEAVPLAVAMQLLARLRSADVQLNIIKGGGHRLSAPHEIAGILRAVASLLEPLP